MKLTSLTCAAALSAGIQSVVANSPIPGRDFTNNNGLSAAEAAAPMWHMPSGTCMPSAAEDADGHQTNGVNADYCNILKLAGGCPPQPPWQGTNTFYGNVPGEPWATIPTYWRVARCDSTWKIIYYIYFKKDTGHTNDWEGIVITFRDNGGDTWVRDNVRMEQDGNHKQMTWSDLNDTFDSDKDRANFRQKDRNHGKFYFGKFHHSVHHDWHTATFKDTCPPNSQNDFRNADYQFWSKNNLRHTSVLNPAWNWGSAVSPANVDICCF